MHTKKLCLSLLSFCGLSVLLLICSAASAQTANSAEKYPDTNYPVINYGTGEHADSIKRGEYLVKAGDCIACHTTPGGQPFAGGLPIKTPFGTIYSQNITPDTQYGIGKWTDDQFVRVLREGISPKGRYYFPVFPYPYFNKLTQQDALDIRAYLAAIPAVPLKNRPLDMPWPFNVRLLQSFWRFLFFDFHKGEFQPDPNQSPEWNRGAYLVQGLGHCSLCHSPLNKLGAPIQKYELAGGFIEGYSAPNISATGLLNVPTDKVLDVFLKDQKWNGGQVQGPMLQVNHDSLRYLSTQDLTAIVTYLRTVQSKTPPAPSVGTGAKAGEAIYQKYCTGCHMAGGGGAPKFGDSGQWAPFLKAGMDTVYNNAIKGIDGMPAKGNCDACSDEQIKSAVDYIVGQSKSGGGAAAANTTTLEQKQTSLARGQQVYQQVCSICHADGKLGAPKLGDKAAWVPLVKTNLDVLITRAIQGYKGHPAKGSCYECTDADIIAAVKYMAQQSGAGNYTLW